jgi:hypothetical protein
MPELNIGVLHDTCVRETVQVYRVREYGCQDRREGLKTVVLGGEFARGAQQYRSQDALLAFG